MQLPQGPRAVGVPLAGALRRDNCIDLGLSQNAIQVSLETGKRLAFLQLEQKLQQSSKDVVLTEPPCPDRSTRAKARGTRSSLYCRVRVGQHGRLYWGLKVNACYSDGGQLLPVGCAPRFPSPRL